MGPPHTANNIPQPPLAGCRILVIEDDLIFQRQVSHFLNHAGGEVCLANCGQEGIDRVLEGERQNTPFHVILMDFQMPEMDGAEATRRIRWNGSGVPIVALSACEDPDLPRKMIQAGCDDFLSKPVSGDSLVRLLTRYYHSFLELEKRISSHANS